MFYMSPDGNNEVDKSLMEDYAFYGYVRGLGDKYSAYTNAEEAKKMFAEQAGNFTGIGVLATQNQENGLIEILEVYANSPAMEAGIEPRDIIIEVDGTLVEEVGYDSAIDMILGEEGTSVTIKVDRNGTTLDFTMVRRVIDVKSVTYKMLDNNIGYIRIHDFNDVTYDGFAEAMTELQKQAQDGELSGVVFDLRNNLGGTLDSIVAVLDDILPEGDIVKLVNKSDEERVYKSDEREINIPMCVLVNGATASASELFAGSLRDYDKAEIIGTTTYGKGCALGIFSLSDGSIIALVDEMYYTASGANFEGKGLEPDYVVEMPDELLRYMFYLDENEDPQLRKAVEVLTGNE